MAKQREAEKQEIQVKFSIFFEILNYLKKMHFFSSIEN